ncbi:hypothetical protein [Agrococcus carbonis]|uniref:Uncharacterized protein n=1 Tax=Agrococcus carbonis TaxID=684552 RepID=A0A1H1QLZ1_9MICO|nr:hypothetical protein [Agrococcus carbonis]SDS24357.1 hypothetical protein SAMN04489719_1873 [Agrococcus carbonis]
MTGADDIADAGMQAFDDEHRLVERPGERPDWEAREEAEAAGEQLDADDDAVPPGAQSPANEPLGSDLGGEDAFGAGATDSDLSGGNWADADDAGASDTGIAPPPGGASGSDDPFDGAGGAA